MKSVNPWLGVSQINKIKIEKLLSQKRMIILLEMIVSWNDILGNIFKSIENKFYFFGNECQLMLL